MIPTVRQGVVPWLVLLALLQGGCLAESAVDGVDLKCGPRDLTPECCLKQSPGQWEKCTGTSGPAEAGFSISMKTTAAGTAVAVAFQPIIGSAERRGVELATDVRSDVEEAIVKCVRRADREANDQHFDGESPSREQCAESKREGQTWAMYLGHHKHNLAWPCLREALEELLPRRYLLEARFQFNGRIGKWEYLTPATVDQIVSREGWKTLKGSIAPDIVIMDEQGNIIHVYDIKFPCPESNWPRWDTYMDGRWAGQTQGELYTHVLQAEPRLVSPRQGVVNSGPVR